MDFSFSTEADEAAALTAQIVTAEVTPDRVRALGSPATGRIDRSLWRSLGEAGLLGLALPEAAGGAGLGLIEAARVVVELGRAVAPVPVATHLTAAIVLAENDAAPDLVAGAAAGTNVLSVAIAEDDDADPLTPETRGSEEADGGWVLRGAKTTVRAGLVAEAFLVTAATAAGTAVLLVRGDDPGVTLTPQPVLDGDVVARVELDDVRLGAERLVGAPDGAAAARLSQLATALTCAEQLGVCEGALALTAAYAKEREQFDRPIGTFQAVSQRLADGYIDTLGARLTLWQAIWRLSERLPAAVEVATAKLWAADAGHRLAHTTVHIHGGVGIDLDGEAHRYFTGAKRLEFVGGGATDQARRIGSALAAGAVR